jgi:radical S-adenosyl methionine domain-containing protein 2
MITTVNFHLIKACNFRCKFCYATFNDISSKEIKAVIKKEHFEIVNAVAQSGYFKKINFAGGEPTLVPHITELIQYAKSLGLETSIVTNASKIDAEWVKNIAGHLDILTISVDSITPETNHLIGRESNRKQVEIDNLLEIAKTCHLYGIALKINTVVCSFNKNEILADFINQVKPFRWKILQATQVEGQNNEQYDSIKVSQEEFEAFCHNNQQHLLPDIKVIIESSDLIQGSYIMIDPLGRFYDSSTGKYQYSDKILEVGLREALNQIQVDGTKFINREGNYSIRELNVKIQK